MDDRRFIIFCETCDTPISIMESEHRGDIISFEFDIEVAHEGHDYELCEVAESFITELRNRWR